MVVQDAIAKVFVLPYFVKIIGVVVELLVVGNVVVFIQVVVALVVVVVVLVTVVVVIVVVVVVEVVVVVAILSILVVALRLSEGGGREGILVVLSKISISFHSYSLFTYT